MTKTNLDGDGQADLRFHGGEDKALCVYCEEHYAYWAKILGKELEFGAFGENLTVRGLLESDVCIGDIFKLGEVIVQVTQPRQPCYKLAKKHENSEMVERVQDTGYTGYYLRVLQEGFVPAKPLIERLEKHPAAVTVAYANQIKYHDKEQVDAIERILSVQELSEAWRASFQKRLADLGS
ncbi:6-N-hydroxylaminopurine resistance protein [compost metagenome]